MDGFDVHLNMENSIRLQQRVVRVLLTSQIPAIAHPVCDRIIRSFDEEFTGNKTESGRVSLSIEWSIVLIVII